MKKLIKPLTLIIGLINFIFLIYLSYNIKPYSLTEPFKVKVIITVVVSIVYIFLNLFIINPKIFTKKKISKDIIITIYFGIFIIPLIMLYN